MVLRMEPPESVVETSRLREFELIQALDGVVPVPPCYWVDADGECLPHPALIYGFVTGVTRTSSLKSTQVTEMAPTHGPEMEPLLPAQSPARLGDSPSRAASWAPPRPPFEGPRAGTNRTGGSS